MPTIDETLIQNEAIIEGRTFLLPRQGDKHKNPEQVRVRTLTREEVLGLRGHSYAISNTGKLVQVKINGKVRTWKRDPERVEVQVKYGMYEYATLNLQEAMTRLVKEC